MREAELPISTQASRQARELVRGMLNDAGREPAHDVDLVVSELVTNAVRYARTFVRMRSEVAGPVLRLQIIDDGPGRPVLVPPGDLNDSGRGLVLVQALTQSWGVCESGASKSVWCVFELS